MGFQDAIIKIKGRVGDLSFFKTKDGYGVRQATGVDGKRIKNDPKYARTRENMTEFQHASKSTKTFRAAFAEDVKAVADGKLSRRIGSLFHKLLRQDAVNNRGSRKVLPASTAQLEGLQFNQAMTLEQRHKLPFTAHVDRAAGSLSVEIPAFSPLNAITRPDGTTHFVLRATAAEIDFESEKFLTVSNNSAAIRVDELVTEAMTLGISIPGTTKPLFLAFGISFLQIIGNGVTYALKTGLHEVMQVVKVDTGVAV